jgi:hypothetical protein
MPFADQRDLAAEISVTDAYHHVAQPSDRRDECQGKVAPCGMVAFPCGESAYSIPPSERDRSRHTAAAERPVSAKVTSAVFVSDGYDPSYLRVQKALLNEPGYSIGTGVAELCDAPATLGDGSDSSYLWNHSKCCASPATASALVLSRSAAPGRRWFIAYMCHSGFAQRRSGTRCDVRH